VGRFAKCRPLTTGPCADLENVAVSGHCGFAVMQLPVHAGADSMSYLVGGVALSTAGALNSHGPCVDGAGVPLLV
jgi:hypothetical protein